MKRRSSELRVRHLAAPTAAIVLAILVVGMIAARSHDAPPVRVVNAPCTAPTLDAASPIFNVDYSSPQQQQRFFADGRGVIVEGNCVYEVDSQGQPVTWSKGCVDD